MLLSAALSPAAEAIFQSSSGVRSNRLYPAGGSATPTTSREVAQRSPRQPPKQALAKSRVLRRGFHPSLSLLILDPFTVWKDEYREHRRQRRSRRRRRLHTFRTDMNPVRTGEAICWDRTSLDSIHLAFHHTFQNMEHWLESWVPLSCQPDLQQPGCMSGLRLIPRLNPG